MTSLYIPTPQRRWLGLTSRVPACRWKRCLVSFLSIKSIIQWTRSVFTGCTKRSVSFGKLCDYICIWYLLRFKAHASMLTGPKILWITAPKETNTSWAPFLPRRRATYNILPFIHYEIGGLSVTETKMVLKKVKKKGGYVSDNGRNISGRHSGIMTY